MIYIFFFIFILKIHSEDFSKRILLKFQKPDKKNSSFNLSKSSHFNNSNSIRKDLPNKNSPKDSTDNPKEKIDEFFLTIENYINKHKAKNISNIIFLETENNIPKEKRFEDFFSFLYSAISPFNPKIPPINFFRRYYSKNIFSPKHYYNLSQRLITFLNKNSIEVRKKINEYENPDLTDEVIELIKNPMNFLAEHDIPDNKHKKYEDNYRIIENIYICLSALDPSDFFKLANKPKEIEKLSKSLNFDLTSIILEYKPDSFVYLNIKPIEGLEIPELIISNLRKEYNISNLRKKYNGLYLDIILSLLSIDEKDQFEFNPRVFNDFKYVYISPKNKDFLNLHRGLSYIDYLLKIIDIQSYENLEKIFKKNKNRSLLILKVLNMFANEEIISHNPKDFFITLKLQQYINLIESLKDTADEAFKMITGHNNFELVKTIYTLITDPIRLETFLKNSPFVRIVKN